MVVPMPVATDAGEIVVPGALTVKSDFHIHSGDVVELSPVRHNPGSGVGNGMMLSVLISVKFRGVARSDGKKEIGMIHIWPHCSSFCIGNTHGIVVKQSSVNVRLL